MYILGWHGGYCSYSKNNLPGWSAHDASAALLKDNIIVAAIEDERKIRLKHSNFFPEDAIKACLKFEGIAINDVDIIACNFRERPQRIFPFDVGLPSTADYLNNASLEAYGISEMLDELFLSSFGTHIKNKLCFVDHHISHIWCGKYFSGFNNALAVAIDGSGDGHSGMIARFEGDELIILEELPLASSMGNLYSEAIKFLGYRRFDEYKVMGLAPYGDNKPFNNFFENVIRIDRCKRPYICSPEEMWEAALSLGWLRNARRKDGDFTKGHKDYASALQNRLEEVVLEFLSDLSANYYGLPLILVGGVAQNSKMCGRIAESGLFPKIFVPPAAHDAGGAVGAAFAMYKEKSNCSKVSNPTVYLGCNIINQNNIHKTLESWNDFIDFYHIDKPHIKAAELISNGAVIGWCQDRAEFGPRSLGNRSILADPRPHSNINKINSIIKFREGYRPFAPSVLEEYFKEIFHVPRCKADYSYMGFVLKVKSNWRKRLCATTHIDGSARPQCVAKHQNPKFWCLIYEFFKITEVPVLLNTSFNNNHEPIVNDVYDAIACLLTTKLDCMIIDNYLIYPRNRKNIIDIFRQVNISLAKHRKIKFYLSNQDIPMLKCVVSSSASDYFASDIVIKFETGNFLLKHIKQKYTYNNNDMDNNIIDLSCFNDDIKIDLMELWKRRAICVKPI